MTQDEMQQMQHLSIFEESKFEKAVDDREQFFFPQDLGDIFIFEEGADNKYCVRYIDSRKEQAAVISIGSIGVTHMHVSLEQLKSCILVGIDANNCIMRNEYSKLWP